MDLGEQIAISPVTRYGGWHRRTPAQVQLLSESVLVIARASRVWAGEHPALRMKRWEGSSALDLPGLHTRLYLKAEGAGETAQWLANMPLAEGAAPMPGGSQQPLPPASSSAPHHHCSHVHIASLTHILKNLNTSLYFWLWAQPFFNGWAFSPVLKCFFFKSNMGKYRNSIGYFNS